MAVTSQLRLCLADAVSCRTAAFICHVHVLQQHASTCRIPALPSLASPHGLPASAPPPTAGRSDSWNADVRISALQAATLARRMPGNRMSRLVDAGGGALTVPIFHVSSVTGAGLALVHSFLRALPSGKILIPICKICDL